MSDKSSTIFWKDGDGCHWCLRKATSITEGHDGMCPVPYASQLEADRDEYRNLYHPGEAKISSREAIIEQLSESELAKDVTRLEAENEGLSGGLRHIKRWCSGEIVTLNPRQILDAIVGMCDDALLTEEDLPTLADLRGIITKDD